MACTGSAAEYGFTLHALRSWFRWGGVVGLHRVGVGDSLDGQPNAREAGNPVQASARG